MVVRLYPVIAGLLNMSLPCVIAFCITYWSLLQKHEYQEVFELDRYLEYCLPQMVHKAEKFTYYADCSLCPIVSCASPPSTLLQ